METLTTSQVALSEGATLSVGTEKYRIVQNISGSDKCIFRAVPIEKNASDGIILKAISSHYRLKRNDFLYAHQVREAIPLSSSRFSRYLEMSQYFSSPYGTYFYAVLNYIPGVPLSTLDLGEDFSEVRVERMRAIMSSFLLKVLGCLQWNGIVHRDIRPENIICAPDGREKGREISLQASLIDPDTLCFVQDSGKRYPGLIHTPFSSPEQSFADPLTPASDLSSFASSLLSKLELEIRNALAEAFFAEGQEDLQGRSSAGTLFPARGLEIFFRFLKQYPPSIRKSVEQFFRVMAACLHTKPQKRPSVEKALTMLSP